MRSLIILLIVLCNTINGSAQLYQESTNYAMDSYIEKNLNFPVVREIRGGTVFKISYGEGWTTEMKGAFEYACKIWEENLPPSLPITIFIVTVRKSKTKSIWLR